MKKIFTFFSFIALAAISLTAQSRLVVAPGVGTLEDAIKNDSANRPADRVYVLRRGAPYVLRGTIINTGYMLRLEAEAGTGARPLIVYSAQGGVTLNQLFELRGNFSARNIAFTSRDLANGLVERLIAVSADNVSMRLDSCFADDVAQSVIRVNNAGAKIYLTNSIFSRVGDPKNPDNGRIIDKRGPGLDTVIIHNSVLYNITSRVIRDGGTANPSNHIVIDQNTIWGVGQRCLSIGKAKDLVITNNIFQNCGILGTGKTATSPTYILEPDTTFRGQNWTIRNNNFSSNPQVIAALPVRSRGGLGDSLVSITVYNTRSQPVATNTFTEVITFRNAPVLPDYFVTDNRSDTTTATTRNNARPWNHGGLTKDAIYSQLGTPPVDRFSTSHDFGYGSWRPAFKNGTTGQPLGARMFAPTTSVNQYFDASGVMTYPNPAHEVLYLAGLENAKVTKIEVINVAGQVVNMRNTEGVNFLELTTQNLHSGIYILKMTNAEGKISSRKFSKL
jgi:hypothetical protein